MPVRYPGGAAETPLRSGVVAERFEDGMPASSRRTGTPRTAHVEQEDRPLSNDRFTSSRPVALLSAVVGTAILVFGVVRMLDGGAARDGGGVAFLALWCVAGVAIIGRNLWVTFATKSSPAAAVPAGDEDSRGRR
jgi:hypothetical protein